MAMTYDEAVKIWGARKLGLTEQAAEVVEVKFHLRGFMARFSMCDSCGGAEPEAEFKVEVSAPGFLKWEETWDEYDVDAGFTSILAEIVEVANGG